MLTQAELKATLSYDPETGIFTWVKPNSPRFAGKQAGSVTHYGYIVVSIKRVHYLAHRLAWLWVYGEIPTSNIDHINEVKTDNRIENLRIATRSENMRNVRIRSSNTSGYKGVGFDRRQSKWYASITINYKKKFLGYFPTPEECHVAYCRAADLYHGEFANYGLSDFALTESNNNTGLASPAPGRQR